MLKFTEDCLNKKLSEASETMPDKVAPKAYRNKMHGYKPWKEGYVSRVRVKPGLTAGLFTLCLAKVSVSVSTERGIFAVFSFISLFSVCSKPVVCCAFSISLHASTLDNLTVLSEQLTHDHYIRFTFCSITCIWLPFRD